jgi:integrase
LPASTRSYDYAITGNFYIDTKDDITQFELASALNRKFPNAGKQFKWQLLFLSFKSSRDPYTGNIGRHHFHSRTLSKALSNVTEEAVINKYVICPTLRHSFASHLLDLGVKIMSEHKITSKSCEVCSC